MKKFIAPLILFGLLGLLLAYGLKLDPRQIPSPLIGKPLPEFNMPTLADPARTVNKQQLLGRPYLLNIWASWCPACQQEHGLLNEIARQQTVTIIGLNWKNDRNEALKWLERLGNPYALNIHDPDNHLGMDLGVYGAPETFVIDAQGIIRYKHIGPITPETLEQKLLPLIRELS